MTPLSQQWCHRKNIDWYQQDEYVYRLVTDRSKFDHETGHWVDQYGKEGYDPQAYIDDGKPGGNIVIGGTYQIRVDHGIEDNKSNPLVVERKAMTEGTTKPKNLLYRLLCLTEMPSHFL